MPKTTVGPVWEATVMASRRALVVTAAMRRLTTVFSMVGSEQTPTMFVMRLSSAQWAAVWESSSRVGTRISTCPSRREKCSAIRIAMIVFPVPVAAITVARGRRASARVAALTASV